MCTSFLSVRRHHLDCHPEHHSRWWRFLEMLAHENLCCLCQRAEKYMYRQHQRNVDAISLQVRRQSTDAAAQPANWPPTEVDMENPITRLA